MGFTTAEAVANGIKFLDRQYGRENWIDKINLDDLSMHTIYADICGQLERTFDKFLVKWGISHSVACDLGFNSNYKLSYSYDELNEEWKKRIKELRDMVGANNEDYITKAVNILGMMLEQPLITTYYGKDELRKLREGLASIKEDSEVKALREENKKLAVKLDSVRSIVKEIA